MSDVRIVGPQTWGEHPLLHEDGITVFATLLSLMSEKVTVACEACGWRGRRGGFPVTHDDKPCPRCGGSVEITDRSRNRLVRPLTPEEQAALDAAAENAS